MFSAIQRMYFSKGTGLLATGLILAAPAQAADLFDMPLEELLQVKVTAATLTDETVRTAPSSVTVFTRSQIRNMGISYLHELLNYVPGFQSFRQGESSDEYYASSRGQRTGTSSREILILVDGQRFNREFDNAQAVPMISLTNIEKIEFIRGPGSAIYGSNAFLGVINITTVSGLNRLTASYGSNQHDKAELLATSKLGDKVQADVFLRTDHDAGEKLLIQDNTTLQPYETRDPRQGYDLNLKLATENSHLIYRDLWRKAEDFYIIENTSNTYNESINHTRSLQFDQRLQWSDTFQTHYSLAHIDNVWDAAALTSGLYINPDLEEKNDQVNINNDLTLMQGHTLQFGAEFRRAHLDTSYLGGVLGHTPLINENDRDITGIYLQTQDKLAEHTDLTVGARYDHYTGLGDAVSPRLGLVQQLGEVQTIKVLYGEAFRAPTLIEMYSTNNSTVVGNPALKPETIKTWEAVWMGNWNLHSLTINWFDNRIEDGIDQGFIGATRTFVNTGKDMHSQGVEFEYLADLTPAWKFRTQFSDFYLLPETSLRQSRHLASFIMDYHQQSWGANFSATYADQRAMMVGSGEQTLPAYWLFNAKLQYFLQQDLTMYLQAKNLFDKDYRTPTQGVTLTEGVPNRGRELELGARWKF